MSLDPFEADATTAGRIAHLAATIGEAFTEAIEASLAPGHVVPGAAVEELVVRFALTGPREAVLLALPVATRLAQPPISGFFVGAVGLEARSGDLILGGNVEFPGHDLGSTLHGEGFICVRAFARDSAIEVLAIGEARPCAHCRQTISEFAWSGDLRLIDLLGHTLTMAQLYPWPFVPADLGEPGIVPSAIPWPTLAIADPAVPADVAELLTQTGGRAHAPYSHCPAAVVLRLAGGHLVAGSTIESVSFNPTIGPLQAAIVELLADGHATSDIRAGYLAMVDGGAVDPSDDVRSLLASIAPDASLTVTTWA